MNSGISLKNAINLLIEKQEILSDLLNLTVKQKEMLKISDEAFNQEAFLICVEERNRMMESIDDLDKLFLEQIQKLKDKTGYLYLDQVPKGIFEAEEVKKLQETTQEIQEKLQQVSAIDNENRETMKTFMETLKGEIQQIQKGKKAIHGYANTKQKQPSLFMDKKEKKDHRV
ncbi:flagellar export chaperone FlgN [Tindallia californiensis]|uniref:FlgN protein n=1 Tax=Tindallia californiensis TaxID=159292 RepID=A0A1H3L9C4_9FIRM|nr:flagellar export chaperone FlgN [Tindallia californiensis]SDY61043.1 FlgN protein [Tindallia californiensis]